MLREETKKCGKKSTSGEIQDVSAYINISELYKVEKKILKLFVKQNPAI
jgi:hypothetical protein